jgi:recombination associated protein RdgC
MCLRLAALHSRSLWAGWQLLLRLCTERKAVPSSAIALQLQEQLDKIERETGRRPRGKQAKELKEEIVQTLLPRAFPKRSHTWVWISPNAKWVVVNAGSLKSADALITLLVETVAGGLILKAVSTQLAPSTAMAQWLQSKEAPAGFSLDRECELKQPDSEKSTVRYARHTLEIDEVAEHISQGKVPTQVALTWNSRVSFVLTQELAIKKIKLLDVVLESSKKTVASPDENNFDADAALSTGELTGLITDLLDALGGEAPEIGLAPPVGALAVRTAAVPDSAPHPKEPVLQ